MADDPPPEFPPESPLVKLWNEPLSKVVALPKREFSSEEAERYAIHSLLLMSVVAAYWNGNKYRAVLKPGTELYPDRTSQRRENGEYQGGDYLGHNIACLAVDADGSILDFDFNHNEIMNSSVEHAESRLVRRVFSLAQLESLADSSRLVAPEHRRENGYYATTLSRVTIFTSLESCAQCAGIMALGTVKEVVYIQRDPGMYLIGNLLRQLTTDGLRAPRPTRAREFGFAFGDMLDEAFLAFRKRLADGAVFCRGTGLDDKPFEKKDPSITSFLCTDPAREIYRAAETAFKSYKPTHGINEPLLAKAYAFLEYAVNLGHRGTSHRV